jgi:predicted DNA-binding transcriptional regulator AlpA
MLRTSKGKVLAVASEFDGLMEKTEVSRETTLSTKHIDYLERNGQFPKRVKLGRRSAWVRSEIGAWIAKQAKRREGLHSGSAVYQRDEQGRFSGINSGSQP